MSISQYKDKAEHAIAEQEYSLAINFYTLAIRGNDAVSELYSGRAKAYYFHMKQNTTANRKDLWKKIHGDCSRAMQLDVSNVDAAYLMGLYHSDVVGKYDRALKLLNEAYEKSMKQTKRTRSVKPQDICHDIFRVRKLLHHSTTTDGIVNFNPLFAKMAALLQQDYHHKIDEINRVKVSKEVKDYKLTSLAVQYNDDYKNLVAIFSNSTNHATVPVVEEPPDHFLCPITFQLMHDPVVSPSGFTYEKSVLCDALERNPTDPLTRKKITIEECYPNTNLKQAIDDYLAQTNHNHA